MCMYVQAHHWALQVSLGFLRKTDVKLHVKYIHAVIAGYYFYTEYLNERLYRLVATSVSECLSVLPPSYRARPGMASLLLPVQKEKDETDETNSHWTPWPGEQANK